jgi:hypothetical protein
VTKKVRFLFFLAVLFLSALALPVLAQSTGGKPIGITDEILASILGGALFGIPFIGLIQLVKTGLIKLFKLTEPIKAWVGYVSSTVVCAAMSAIILSGLGMLNIQNFLTALVLSWLVSNGYYKRQNALRGPS